MRTRPALVIAVAAWVVAAGTAHSQIVGPQVTLDGFAGGIFPDGATRPEISDAFMGGGRLGLQPLPWFRIEGTYGAASEGSARLNHLGADAVFDLLPGRRAVPYALGGWTRIEYDHDPGQTQTLNGWEFGAGVKVRLVPRIFLRFDARDAVVEQDVPHEWLHNPIVTGGLHVAFGGRERDTDADGVADRLDRCPDTPAGAIVDAAGCPQDSDADGVFDGLDRCADTPAGVRVDVSGCPQDGDADGVFDGIDRCPDTPTGAFVDASGCPQDGDTDGVFDGIDRCPDTPGGALVDASGCPQDGDADGVFDGIDRCPDTPAGARVDATGCPVPESRRETELVETGVIRLPEIRFATAKATITPESYAILDEVGAILARHPELAIEIGGHTDSTGDASFNQPLSERRARAVLDYLETNFPDLDLGRFSVVGYGESQPIGDNRTRQGLAQNRRVEFKVIDREAPR